MKKYAIYYEGNRVAMVEGIITSSGSDGIYIFKEGDKNSTGTVRGMPVEQIAYFPPNYAIIEIQYNIPL